jgi:hypothetical protein
MDYLAMAYRIHQQNPQMSMSECISLARALTPTPKDFVKVRLG